MRAQWAAALLSSVGLLAGSASVFAQAPLTLNPFQLDAVLPTYQYDPSRYPLRVIIESQAVAEPERTRGALAMEGSEAEIAAQQLLVEEAEVRCTPARRALLAFAGRSEAATPEATPQGRLASGIAALLPGQSASTAVSPRDQWLAAASPAASMAGSPSPAPTALSGAGRQPALIGGSGSSARQVASNGSGPGALAERGSNARQLFSSSIRRSASVSADAPGRQAPAAAVASRAPAAAMPRADAPGRQAPAATVASRAPAATMPSRTVRSDTPPGLGGASALRVASGASAGDALARARSRADRAISALRGGAVSMRR
jgi:hypothetical protein